MREFFRYLFIILSVGISIFLVGCNNKTKKSEEPKTEDTSIIGTWQTFLDEDQEGDVSIDNATQTFTFKKDNKFSSNINGIASPSGQEANVETNIATDETSTEASNSNSPLVGGEALDITIEGTYTKTDKDITLKTDTVNKMKKEEVEKNDADHYLLTYFNDTVFEYEASGDTLILKLDGQSYTFTKIS